MADKDAVRASGPKTFRETRKALLVKLFLEQTKELNELSHKVISKEVEPTEFYKQRRKVQETAAKLTQLGVFKLCGCGKVYTEKEWDELPKVGRSVTYNFHGAPKAQELRNCSCGSTLTADVRKKENAKPEL